MRCAPRGLGYDISMLAVVVLVPIAIMVIACLLERFEAHAVVGKAAPRARRPLAIEPPAPSLTLVPGEDEDDASRETPDPPGAPGAPAALRTAS